ncbi:PLDc_N domain-containing protein [Phycicoccus sp. CSK15P-2]|uniref:PLD nuclease N-terminal domain-containing protein n=1 Tax=Phycicoccus sp. CSK15P-2 TaxID=2807627 RepID=UPI0019512926|nr:PLD nuclease N-terminal domain-containing protein [Phycicoccus sp. CSK15P-2]MBM6404954.1 PLDc_N domain-containing protein [Phycicoccus sp. CSK15P-2]
MLRYLPYLLSLALTVFCVIDCLQTDEVIVRNLPKVPWLFVILLFPVVGPVAWLVAGRPDKHTSTQYMTQQERWEAHWKRDRHTREVHEREQRRQPPRGPDDDPDFLKGI